VRRLAHGAAVLAALASGAAHAGEPCALAAEGTQTVALSLSAPEGAEVAGVTMVVDHPETRVGIRGEGIQLRQSAVISQKPADAVASANDLGDSVRVVIARPGELPLHVPLLRLHFDRCEGAPPADPAAFACTVRDASDPSTNPVAGVRCAVVAP
jgi:hypothetical protein